MDKNTICIDISGFGVDINFGNIEKDGIEVYIGIYDINSDKTINRIIAFGDKNSKGKSIYVETREQSILDSFLNLSDEFCFWMDEAIEDIESRF